MLSVLNRFKLRYFQLNHASAMASSYYGKKQSADLILFVQKQKTELACQLKYKMNEGTGQELLSFRGIVLTSMTKVKNTDQSDSHSNSGVTVDRRVVLLAAFLHVICCLHMCCQQKNRSRPLISACECGTI